MTYDQECRWDNEIAANAVAECVETGNMPKLVRMIREMAAQDHGVSVGFLYALSELAIGSAKPI